MLQYVPQILWKFAYFAHFHTRQRLDSILVHFLYWCQMRTAPLLFLPSSCLARASAAPRCHSTRTQTVVVQPLPTTRPSRRIRPSCGHPAFNVSAAAAPASRLGWSLATSACRCWIPVGGSRCQRVTDASCPLRQLASTKCQRAGILPPTAGKLATAMVATAWRMWGAWFVCGATIPFR